MGIVNLSLGREQIILFKLHPHFHHPTYEQIHHWMKFEWSSNACASNFNHFGRNAQKLPILLELLAIFYFTWTICLPCFSIKKNSIDFSAKITF